MENETLIRQADLQLLLAESDRDEPFLVVPRRPDATQEPREEIDEQILAGLVTPYSGRQPAAACSRAAAAASVTWVSPQ
jgi:hypothetical protein